MRHAHKGPLARFAARYFRDDAPGQPRIVRVGMPGYEIPVLFTPDPPPVVKHWERLEEPAPARPPWGGASEPGQMTGPATEVLVPEFPDWPLEYPPAPAAPLDAGILRRVAEGLRALPAEPKLYVPDLLADIRDLHVFRDAIRWATRAQHVGCDCEPADETARAGWLAVQYAQIIPAAPSWQAAEPVRDEAVTAEMGAAA